MADLASVKPLFGQMAEGSRPASDFVRAASEGRVIATIEPFIYDGERWQPLDSDEGRATYAKVIELYK